MIPRANHALAALLPKPLSGELCALATGKEAD
jgi:hypothetical protein